MCSTTDTMAREICYSSTHWDRPREGNRGKAYFVVPWAAASARRMRENHTVLIACQCQLRLHHRLGRSTRRRMHGIFGERERANCGRVSSPTAASLIPAASQSREAPPSTGISAILKPTFRISVLTSAGGSRPTGPVLELF